jgi:hypothetical protein
MLCSLADGIQEFSSAVSVHITSSHYCCILHCLQMNIIVLASLSYSIVKLLCVLTYRGPPGGSQMDVAFVVLCYCDAVCFDLSWTTRWQPNGYGYSICGTLLLQ